MSPSLLAIASALFGGITKIHARFIMKGLKSKTMVTLGFFSIALLMLPFSPFFFQFEWNRTSIGLILLVVIIDSLANLCYFRTLEKTEASHAAPLLSLAPIFTFIAAYFFLDQGLKPEHFTALALLLLIVAFSKEGHELKTLGRQTILPALGFSLLFGLSAIPIKLLLSHYEFTNAASLYWMRSILIALLILPFSMDSLTVSKKMLAHIFARSCFVIIGWVLLYHAIKLGDASIVMTLGNLTPIFVFIFAALFLKERITPLRGITALLAILVSILL